MRAHSVHGTLDTCCFAQNARQPVQEVSRKQSSAQNPPWPEMIEKKPSTMPKTYASLPKRHPGRCWVVTSHYLNSIQVDKIIHSRCSNVQLLVTCHAKQRKPFPLKKGKIRQKQLIVTTHGDTLCGT